MPGLGARIADAAGSAVTPDREVEVHFDVDENVLTAPPFSLRRYAGQIVHDDQAFPAASNVELLSSGYWILRPLQSELDRLHESTIMPTATMLLSEFNAIDAVKQEPLYRTPVEIPGIVGGMGIFLAISGDDLFFTTRWPAGTTRAGLSAVMRPAPTQDSLNMELDPVMEAKIPSVPDQGYLLRWQCPGTQRHAPDNLFNFFFGGPLLDDGWGEYCLTFHGTGACKLWEYSEDAWHRRRIWRYCLPEQVMAHSHSMRILPHRRRYIEFRSEVNAVAEVLYFWNFKKPEPYQAPRQDSTVQLYVVNPSKTGQPELDPNYVTGFGYVRFDVRRDQRLIWQVSRLQYPPTGTLADHSFGIPCFADENALIKIRVDGFRLFDFITIPKTPLADITTTPVDASDGSPLAGNAEDGYSLPTGGNVRVEFGFSTTNTLKTPFLRGYTAELQGALELKSIGEVTGGAVVDYSLAGPTSDPTQESGKIIIEDALNELTSLRTRTGQNCRIRTSYDPNDPSLKSTLFLGRVDRPDGKLMGWERGQEYPDPDWYTLAISLTGEWQRLQEQLMIGQFDFSQDDTADESEWVDGTPPPWYLSRVVTHLVSYCGYQENQIDVAALDPVDIRMPLSPESGGDYRPSPFTMVGDYVTRILRDLVGAFLIWDANAINGGLRGMWRVLLGPTIADGATPLYNFTNDEPAPVSGVTLLGRTESYPANTTFIQKGSFAVYPIKPEGNALLVTTTGDLTPDRAQMGLISCAINYRSYNPPGGPGLDDPAGIDYLGRFVPIVITDPLLAPGNTAAERQANLDLVTRRIFNFACRARREVVFEAPLVLVEDLTDSLLDVKRPLRYGDFVTVDGVNCLIRSVNPSWQKDHLMMAYYECQVYRAPE